MIRVVLVDDQELVRAGLRALLERTEDITVVAEAADGAAGVVAVGAERPDVVLMDIRMPGLDGLAATRRIMADRALRAVKVLVLTTFDLDEHVIEAVRAGASGFLLKDTHPDELRRAVRATAAGEAVLAPVVTRRMLDALAATPVPDPAPLAVLTGREREVLTAVGHGLSNGEIARELQMSPATARTHVSRIMGKLHARDRVRLVVIAYETGITASEHRR
jgi:DNA-binding NarL/FixJ family response regulator